jgi:hypothetical protein
MGLVVEEQQGQVVIEEGFYSDLASGTAPLAGLVMNASASCSGTTTARPLASQI